MTERRANPADPTSRDIRRWRRYLADERAEATTYRALAARRTGEERRILLALADAEARHEQYWLHKLGSNGPGKLRTGLGTRLLVLLARTFGSVFVLALMQNAEGRSPYTRDPDATERMAADEAVHAEVVRSLATRSRQRMSGLFRAAVFGVNDGLVSNLALVLGVGATGVPASFVLATGLAGLLAGALSMAAGEFISVTSQRELLRASTPNPETERKIPALDVNENELALVYRARGMEPSEAARRAAATLAALSAGAAHDQLDTDPATAAISADEHEAIGTPWGAAISSFFFFAFGALLPVLPWIFGLGGTLAVVISAAIVGVALLVTGATAGLLSGVSPWWRALRQLLIGYGAAAVTYALGHVFGGAVA